MSMNPFLAELYGTAEVVGARPHASDVEKLAQTKVLGDMLNAEVGVNIDNLPAEKIASLSEAIFGKQATSHMPPAPAAQEEEEKKEEKKEEEKEESDEEKVAQADMLGRIMAHAYVNELSAIEKNANVNGEARAVASGRTKTAQAGGVLDVLAEHRALEHLKQAGVDISHYAQPQSDEEKLAAAVDARAVEIVKALGFGNTLG